MGEVIANLTNLVITITSSGSPISNATNLSGDASGWMINASGQVVISGNATDAGVIYNNPTFNNSIINFALHNPIINFVLHNPITNFVLHIVLHITNFALHNPIIVSICVTLLITYFIYRCVYKKDQWIKAYFEYNKRYTEIRSKLPIEILSNDYNYLETCTHENHFINLLWQYFELCYEQYYLVEEKGWLEDELWQEWKQGIEYNMGLPAFQYAWEKYKEVLKINPNVNRKEVRLKPNYYSKFVCYIKKLIRIRRKGCKPNYFLKFVDFMNELR